MRAYVIRRVLLLIPTFFLLAILVFLSLLRPEPVGELIAGRLPTTIELGVVASGNGGSGGKRAYHPAMLVALLFYGYATGVFSSRKLEQATYDSVAFRYITGDEHPDHDTIASFRKRFLDELQGLFKQILVLAAALGTLRLGRVSLDGTKVQGNASKHKAMSWGHANKLEGLLGCEGGRFQRCATVDRRLQQRDTAWKLRLDRLNRLPGRDSPARSQQLSLC